jgi:outer membrane protein OmpA-like peptidoglycan-associated protein
MILVDRLAFCDKVESPDATKLPVLFAINLLKDKNGRIDLTLPVSGSLEDPQFDIMAVVGQIFGSPLKAAETSPFSLIAAGEGAGDELAYVEFQPGVATLTPDAEKKLATLVKILEDRPGLTLELAARCDAAKDTEALKKALLAQRLAAAPKDLPKEAREKLAAQPIEVGQAELDALAARRAELVKAYLSATGRLPADRVVVASSSAKAPDEPKAHLSRVDFALR